MSRNILASRFLITQDLLLVDCVMDSSMENEKRYLFLGFMNIAPSENAIYFRACISHTQSSKVFRLKFNEFCIARTLAGNVQNLILVFSRG